MLSKSVGYVNFIATKSPAVSEHITPCRHPTNLRLTARESLSRLIHPGDVEPLSKVGRPREHMRMWEQS